MDYCEMCEARDLLTMCLPSIAWNDEMFDAVKSKIDALNKKIAEYDAWVDQQAAIYEDGISEGQYV